MSVTWRPLPPLPERSKLRIGSVVTLYFTRLRARWIEESLAMLGIAVGVALLYAGGIAATSLSGPVKQLNRGIIGNAQLQVVARGPDGVPDTLYDQARALGGVQVAAPVLEVPASLVGPRARGSLTVYGVDLRVVHLRGSLTAGFTDSELAHQEVVAATTKTADRLGLRTGDLVPLQIGGRTHKVGVVVLGDRDVGKIADTEIAIAPISYLQSLSGLRHRISRVLVRASPGQLDHVRADLRRLSDGTGADVRGSDHEPDLFAKTSRPTSQASLISSVLSSLVGFMFAACAMLVTAPARRALTIDLRRSGFSTSQILKVMLIDVAILGAVAGIVGLALGEALSRRGFTADASFLQGAFPVGDERVITWYCVALAVIGGFIAAGIGVLAPIRSQLWESPRRAPVPRRLGSGNPRPTRLVTGLGIVLLLTSAVITVLVPTAALAALACLTLAVPLLVPAALDGAIATSRWLSRRTRRPVMAAELALPQLESSTWRVRSLAIAMTGALAVFGASALQGARSNLQAGLDSATRSYDHVADLWISPAGPGDLFAVTPFPGAEVARLAASTPGVRRVETYRGSFLDVAGNRVWVRAPASTAKQIVPANQILKGSNIEVDQRLRSGGWLAVSQVVADALHVRIGDGLSLPSPRPVVLRVAAITTNLGWPGGAIVLNADDYARAWASPAASAYQVTLDPGTATSSALSALRRAVGSQSGLVVETADQRDRREYAASRSGLARLKQIASLTLVAAIIAMAAAMAGLLLQQRASVARQKLDGHSTGRMWRALGVQSAVLFVTGSALGSITSLFGQVLFSRGLQSLGGFPVEVDLQVKVAVIAFVAVSVIASLVIAVPGYLVARVPPSLRARE